MLALANLLSACGQEVPVGSDGPGCAVYATQRPDMPLDALAQSPRDVVAWVNETDAGMVAACGYE